MTLIATMTRATAWPIVGGLLVAVALLSGAARADPRIHGNFVVVLDSSGSMRGTTVDPAPNRTKMSVARNFAKEIFGRLGRGPRIEAGLIIFGSNYDSDQSANRPNGCRDVSIKLAVRPVDVTTSAIARDAVDAARARGYTPLGLAVAKAIDLLGPAGGSIIVVTDMEETCEDGTTEHACEVLRTANANRMPADRVYVDSIVVAKAPDMKTAAVDRLRDCTQAEMLEITNETDAVKAATKIAERLEDLAAATDQPTSEPPRRLTVLGPHGRALVARDVTLILRQETTGRELRVDLGAPPAAIVVRPGTHRVSTSTHAGPPVAQGTVTVAPESSEIVLSFVGPTP